MIEWIRSDTRRAYRMPSRCRRCGSRNLWADRLYLAHDDSWWIREQCDDCDSARRIRALNPEQEQS